MTQETTPSEPAYGFMKGDASKENMARLLVASLAVGGGAASGIGLFNLFKDLKDRREREQDTSQDDDILTIDVPSGHPMLESKMAKVDTGVLGDIVQNAKDAWGRPKTEGMPTNSTEMTSAILAAAGGTAGTYLLFRKLLQARKKKELQKELDNSQTAYFSGLGGMGPKEAKNRPISQKFVDTTVLLMALTAIAGGVGSYTMMDQHYPKLERKAPDRKKNYPRKIMFREHDEEASDPRKDTIDEDDADVPAYSYTTDNNVSKSANIASRDETREFLLRAILSSEKQATDSGLRNLVTAFAFGEADNLHGNIDQVFNKAGNIVRENNLMIGDDTLRGDLAITCLAMDERIGYALEPVLAAEYNDMTPHMFKLATTLPPEQVVVMEELIHASIHDSRAAAFHPLAECVDSKEIMKSASSQEIDLSVWNYSVSETINSWLKSDDIMAAVRATA